MDLVDLQLQQSHLDRFLMREEDLDVDLICLEAAGDNLNFVSGSWCKYFDLQNLLPVLQ